MANTLCPVCNSDKVETVFTAIDHTVTGESFGVAKCKNCSLLFTENIPSANEIGKYYASENYISHSDTQKGFINKAYHIIRKRTLLQKKELIEKETGKSSGKLLDIGCGTGAFLHAMQVGGWACTGLEPDDAARKRAIEQYNLSVSPADEIYNLPGETYDAVTMWHVLEHVHDLNGYVNQLKKIIKPGGKIFIAVPNYTSFDAKHYGKNWAAYDVPRHLYHFSPKSMDALMQRHGLQVKKTLPMWYDSFYVSMLSEKCKNGKGNILKAFFIGLLSNLKALSNKNTAGSLIYIISK